MEKRRVELIGTLTDWAQVLPEEVRWVEVRADCLGDPSLEDRQPLRISPAGNRKFLYTLRSQEEGGSDRSDSESRAQRLVLAARDYDLVDLEASRDLVEPILEAIPPQQRLISWHGGVTSLEQLERRFATMAETPARLYKLIVTAESPTQGLAPLEFLARRSRLEGRRDIISFAIGPAATWTRLVAPRLGAPWVYASLEGGPAGAPGQISATTLIRDYGLPDLAPAEFLCGVVGHPVSHSLSPRLHNLAYRALGVEGLYAGFDVEAFGDFWLEVVESNRLDALGLPLRGLSVTAPHKRLALAVAGATSPLAEAIGGANTLVRNGSVWEAESTDPVGVVAPLRRRGVSWVGRPVAVLGAGGAGRAAAVAMARAGGEVTLVNRSEDRGRKTAADLGVGFQPLAGFSASGFAVLIHATSLGRRPEDPLPFDPSTLDPGGVVVDLVYTEKPTPLLEAVDEVGGIGIDGREVLLFQAVDQISAMTGRSPSPSLVRLLATSALGLDGFPAKGQT